jgi:hypothetical protein
MSFAGLPMSILEYGVQAAGDYMPGLALSQARSANNGQNLRWIQAVAGHFPPADVAEGMFRGPWIITYLNSFRL